MSANLLDFLQAVEVNMSFTLPGKMQTGWSFFAMICPVFLQYHLAQDSDLLSGQRDSEPPSAIEDTRGRVLINP